MTELGFCSSRSPFLESSRARLRRLIVQGLAAPVLAPAVALHEVAQDGCGSKSVAHTRFSHWKLGNIGYPALEIPKGIVSVFVLSWNAMHTLEDRAHIPMHLLEYQSMI